MTNLVTRSEFAKIAGVSGAAVTKATKETLRPCLDGLLIDADHAAARAYVEKMAIRKTPATVEGIDPRFEEALASCREFTKWHATHIKDSLGVGTDRARKIFQQIQAAGLVGTEAREEKIFEKPAPHIRGTAARKQAQINNDDGDLEVIIPENIAKYAHMPLIEIIEKFGTAARFKDWLSALKEISAIEERNIKIAQQKGKLVSRELVRTQIVEQIDSAHIKLLRDGSRTIATRACSMHGSGEDITEITKIVADLISSFIKPVKVRVARALQEPTQIEGDDDA
ncbi:MAG: hypothetical protein RR182_00960 [Alistipes sp.]